MNVATKNHFDLIVIGGNLAGLVCAQQAAANNLKVAIVEAKNQLGGSCASVKTKHTSLPATLGFIPENESAIETLNWFSELLGEQIVARPAVETEPKTFVGGKLIPFVGFGDRKFHTTNELAPYNVHSMIGLASSPEEWVNRLTDKFLGERFLQSEVTDLNFSEDHLVSITINGSKNLSADRFVFALSPKTLAELAPPEYITAKVRQKIAKSKTWTALHLHFEHSENLCNSSELHFLMGSKSDFEPCLGRFITQDDRQFSTWISLVASDLSEDAEHAGSVIRNMKKQIKRAYPQALENLKEEKIVVHPEWSGHINLALKGNKAVPGAENLFLATRIISELGHPMGDLESAKTTLAAMDIGLVEATKAPLETEESGVESQKKSPAEPNFEGLRT